jgi:hypothetical protein
MALVKQSHLIICYHIVSKKRGSIADLNLCNAAKFSPDNQLLDTVELLNAGFLLPLFFIMMDSSRKLKITPIN